MQSLAKKQQAKDTYLKIVKDSMSYEDVKKYVDTTTREEYEIKRELETLEIQDDIKSAYQEELRRTEELLKNFREMFKEISDLHETNQRQMKADVIRLLVRQLIVETIGIIKGKRDYKIQGNMRLGATITSSDWDEFNRG